MGRPAWATDKQWDWLKAQAAVYLKVKGTRATADFWPGYYSGWAAKWPIPALTDLVNETSTETMVPGDTLGGDDNSSPDVGSSQGGDDAAGVGGETTSTEEDNGKKPKKPLTVKIVSLLFQSTSYVTAK
jgi:hypothetical protein